MRNDDRMPASCLTSPGRKRWRSAVSLRSPLSFPLPGGERAPSTEGARRVRGRRPRKSAPSEPLTRSLRSRPLPTGERWTKKFVLAARCACEVCIPPQQQSSFDSLPSQERGERSAERRIQPMSAPHRKCCHLPVRGARKRAINGSPLAFRRSTAALAKALTPWLSFGPRFLELPGANGRTLPGASAASTSRTGHSAGRDDARSRPSAGLRSPPAGTAFRSASGSSLETPLDEGDDPPLYG